MQRLINGDFEPLEQTNPTLEPALIELNNALLKPKPADRPHSLTDALHTLKQVILPLQSDSASNDTLAFSGSGVTHKYENIQSKHSPTQTNHTLINIQSRRFKLLGATLTLSLGIAAVFAYLYWPNPQLYVAVLPPEINNGSPVSPQQQILLLEAISSTIEQGIIDTNDLSLISPQNLEDTQGDDAKVAMAVGADVLIKTYLNCQQQRCDIDLQRVQLSDQNTIIKNQTNNTAISRLVLIQQQQWPIVIDDQYLNISHDLKQRIHALFPKHKQTVESAPSNINEVDYLWLIDMRHQIINEGQETTANWDKLLAAKGRYSDYPPYYQLLNLLALDLYVDTAEVSYLDILQQQLNRAEKILGLHLWIIESRFHITLRLSQFENSAILLKQMKGIQTDEVTQLKNMALLDRYQGKYKQANILFDKALALKPSIKLWQDKAINHWLSGDNKTAKITLEQIFKLDKNYYDALILLAEIYLNSGNLDKAIEQYQKVIKINPQTHHFNNLGLAYELQGDYQLAYQAFKKAIQFSPNNTWVLLNLADSLKLLNKINEANNYYKKILKLNEKNTDENSLLIRALAQIQIGEVNLALNSILLTLRKSPDNPEVLLNAALIYSLAEQGDTAITYIKQSIVQGVNPIWFKLPWFDGLCTKHFLELNRLTGKSFSRCS